MNTNLLNTDEANQIIKQSMNTNYLILFNLNIKLIKKNRIYKSKVS